jgi:hypothetical protein
MALVHRARLAGREEVLSLTPAEKREAQARFAEAKQAALAEPDKTEAALRGLIPLGGPCRWCGGLHERACNRVRKLEWAPNGNLLSAEFWKTWEQPGAVWPEDAYDPAEGDAGG